MSGCLSVLQAGYLLVWLLDSFSDCVWPSEIEGRPFHRLQFTGRDQRVIDRREAIQPAFDLLHAILDEIIPIDMPVIEAAKTLVLGYSRLSARDALHVAVMQEHGIDRIMSFDRGFDAIPGLRRLGG